MRNLTFPILLAFILPSMGGCVDPAATKDDDDSEGLPDSADTSETGDEPEDPWLAEGYWEATNELQALFDFSLAPRPRWEVWMLSSEDGIAWDFPGRLLMHSLSSLDLIVLDDTLLLLGMPFVIPEIDWGCENPARGRFLVFSTRDLEHWGSRYFLVEGDDATLVIDPTLHPLDASRQRLSYFAVPEGFGGEPSSLPGPHEFRAALREGERFVAQTEPLFEVDGGADPSVCLIGGVHHLFSTIQGNVLHATAEPGMPFVRDEGFSWTGFTVPFCHEREGGLEVLAHNPIASIPPQRTRMDAEGRIVSREDVFEDLEQLRGYPTALVTAWFQGASRLFFSVWTSEDLPY